MVVGRLGSTSKDGVTVVYDANTEEMIEARIPRVPEGTQFALDNQGNWKIVFNESAPTELNNRLRQAEEFYYATRDFLFYDDYVYIQKTYPTNCAKKFKTNPFFITTLTKENTDIPICTAPVVDSHIILSTFEDRKQEMFYIIKHALQRNESNGHTWMYYSELESYVKKTLASDGHPLLSGGVFPYIRYFSDDFYFEPGTDLYSSKVGLFSTYNTEYIIYRAVSSASRRPTPFPLYEHINNEDLSTEQNKAIKNIITKGGHISILTGGPGTGKTTILREAIDTLLMQYPYSRVHLLAPTGKASKRIKEVFGERDISISTVHKFLGYGHILTRKELDVIHMADLVVVDESSMLDLEIFSRLLTLLDMSHTKLILVGDVDQLPSIGAGNILSDLITLGVHTERLTENYRSLGSIVFNARKMNAGELFLREDDSFKIIDGIPAFASDFVTGMDKDADIVITPYRVQNKRGSATNINKIAQERIFRNSRTFSTGDFRVGDVVVMNHTNYKQGYFNGESGVVLAFLPTGDYVVGFGDRELTVKNPKEMDLGYAITTYKSQGSEYDDIDICIPEFSDFVTRRMLYTAVTRAKRRVRLFASKSTIFKIIMNNPEQIRRTFLSTFNRL